MSENALPPETPPRSQLHNDADDDFLIVGIGASAGGLEALEQVFSAFPPDTGMAFIVIQHLSPDFKSHMEELLGRHTTMPIHRVTDQMPVEPNRVYLIPSRTTMVISERKLLLTQVGGGERIFQHPIDQFFSSLGHDAGDRGVAVVLSGSGSDGSRGIRDVHEAGGLVVAQDRDSSKFDGMPLSAEATGVVDLVLPPQEIASVLTRLATERLSIDDLLRQEQNLPHHVGFEKIFQLLHESQGLDFSHYKTSTVGRRIQRRIEMMRLGTVEEYIELLQSSQAEVAELYSDLLIGVTRFFRDTEAFDSVARDVIPTLFERAASETKTIRVWVAGCASGEEAYSMAILFDEERRRRHSDVDVKIFATDAHQGSLQKAAKGIYPPELVKTMSPERIRRYFRLERDGYHVVREMRQSIVFAHHNLIHDAPFTQIDFVSCRNLLIYMQGKAQTKALSLFHFSLRLDGFLMLGPSESATDLAEELIVIDRRWRIYKKRREVRLPIETRMPLHSPVKLANHGESKISRESSRRVDAALLWTYDQLLQRNLPPSVLIDDRGEILHVFGDAHRYLVIRSGRPSTNLFDIVHPQLKTAVTSAVQHALRREENVKYSGIEVRLGGETESVSLLAEPIINEVTQVTNLHLKLDVDQWKNRLSDPVVQITDTLAESAEAGPTRVALLESELRYTQENLHATVEEMETSHEELQASNEELVASNEELQSTNEELHSVNEELYTVNAEHQRHVEELAQANQDMDNLLATTHVGVIFLDRDFFIRRFTPEIGRVFHLVPQDIGRSIEGFASNLRDADLIRRLRQVRQRGDEHEVQVTDALGTPFLLRIVPYRQGGKFAGIVITLVNVTTLRDAQTKAHRNAERLQTILDATPDGIYGVDSEGVCTFCNRAALRLLGYAEESDLIGKRVHDLLHHSRADGRPRPADECMIYRAAADTDPPLAKRQHPPAGTQPDPRPPRPVESSGKAEAADQRSEEVVFWRSDGTCFPVEYWSHPMLRDGKEIGLVVTFQDITTRVKMRREQLQMVEELEVAHRAAQDASEAKSSFLANMSHELRSPMSAVLGFAEVLQANSDDPVVREHAGTIQRNGKYLLALLNDILDLSKIEAGKMQVTNEPTDVFAVIEEVRSLMHVRAVGEGVPLYFDWRTEVPRYIHSDQVRLRQILVNLIGNALKFTEEGQVRVEISTDYDRSCDSPQADSDSGTPCLSIAVVDTGIGMTGEQMSQAFQPFSQVSSDTHRRYGGTGLGLSISRRLAEALGGEIDVESEPGRGSRFTLSLKLNASELGDVVAADPQDATDPQASNTAANSTSAAALPRLTGRFLVVDDREDIHRVVKFFIEKCGGEVTVAENGRLAVEAAVEARGRGRPFHLVVMDMHMPVMNGREAVAELRRLGFTQPIIALTADAMDGEREECLSIGCAGYFAKPVAAAPLLHLIASLLSDHADTKDATN